MKKIFIFSTLLLILSIFSSKIYAQAIESLEFEDYCDNETEFYLTIKISGMNTVGNNLYQLSFSSSSLDLYNDTDYPESDLIYESQNQDTVVLKFPAYDMTQPAPGISTHTVNVNIGQIPDDATSQVELLQGPSVSFVTTQVSLCESDAPFDLNSLTTPGGGEYYMIDNNYDVIDTDIINGNYFDPSIPVPSNAYGSIGYEIEAANGCIFKEDYAFSIPTINSSPNLEATSITDASCGQDDGSANVVVASGGEPPFNYSWSNGTTGDDLINAGANVYQAYVEDVYGCIGELDVSIGVNEITTTLNITQPTCWDDKGSIDLDVTTGSNYQTYWSFGAYGDTHTNLNPGTYYGTVTNDDGCEETVIADLTPASPTPITVSDFYIGDEDCNSGTTENGYVDLYSVTGGAPGGNYSYIWSNGATSTYNGGLASGDYTVTITDVNGCSIQETYHVGQWSFNSLYYIYLDDVSPSTCNDDGSVELYVSDPSSEITSYSWSNGSNDFNLNNVSAGEYTFNYTDTYGCSDQITATIPAIKPQNNPICLITVDSITTTNLIVWEREETTNISGYNIYREEGAGNYNWIGFNPASEETVFNDVTASPKVKSWSYKISAVNSCGVEGNKSLAHRTSHLKRTQNGTQFNLNWNLYEGFDYSANGIDIYRYTDTQGEWVWVDNVSATTTSYPDNVVDFAGIDYALDYVPLSGCTATKAQNHNSSRSNETEGIFNPGEGTGDTNNELSELDLASEVNLYPNPNNGLFTITLEGFENYDVDFVIMDIHGKVIQKGVISNNIAELSLNHIESGVYFVQMTTSFHNVTKRFMKQ